MFRRLLLPFLALTALTLTACGGGAGGDSPYAAFIAGVESAGAEDTVQFELSATSTLGGQEIEVTGVGAQALDGSVAEFQASTAFAGQAFDVDTRIIDTTIYLNSPQLAQITGTDAWIELTPEDMEAQTGFDISQFTESAQQAQSSFDQMLGMVEEDFTEVGQEDINGVATTHYRGTVDTAQAMEAIGTEGVEELFAGLPETYEMEVWIDEDNLPRRVLTDLDVEAEGQTVTTTTTIDFLEYGVDLDVEAPEDTVSFSELKSGLSGR